MKKIILFLLLVFLAVAGFTTKESILNLLKGKLDVYNKVLPYEKVYLQSDRPFYKPGDDIWFSVWITNGITNMPSDVSEVVIVEFINPKGYVEKSLHLLVEKGRAAGDFKMDSLALGGIYKIKAHTNWMQNFGVSNQFVKEVQVQDLSLPRLRMKLELERKAYGPNDTVRAQLWLQTLENTPIAQKEFSCKVNLDGNEFLNLRKQTDKEGKSVVSFVLPPAIKTNNGLLSVTIQYAGNIETISRSIPIILNQVDLKFFPEGGDLVAGTTNNCAFKALNEYGKPADVEGVIYDSKHQRVASFKSYNHGMGAFRFEPQLGEKYYALISRPQGIFQLYLLPEPVGNGFLMELPKPMQFIRSISDTGWVRVVAPNSCSVSLVAQVQGRIIYSINCGVVKGENIIGIPLKDFPSGVAQITLFTQENIETCERLVFVKKDESMSVSIISDKKSYQPRDKVSLTVKTTNAHGAPVAAKLALSVVDDKLLLMSNDKSDNILSYLLLSSEVNGKIEEPSFYFNPLELKADSATDYLLLTQGWRRFTWKEIVETSNSQIRKKVVYSADKRIISGYFSLKSPEDYKRTRIFIKSTGQRATLNEKGYYEVANVDLTTPQILVAISPQNDTIKTAVYDYSASKTVNNYRFNNSAKGGVKGVIIDKLNRTPLAGASVHVKGDYSVATSDLEGRYIISSVSGNVLQVSLIGYEKFELALDKSKTQFDVELVPVSERMDKVVVGAGIAGSRKNKGMVAPKPEREHDDFVEEEMTEVRFLNARSRDLVKEKPLYPLLERDDNNVDAEMIYEDKMYDTDEVELYENSTTETITTEEEQAPFIIVEQMPEFPGGNANIAAYISSAIRFPAEASDQCITGKVYISFVIDRDGWVTKVKVARGIYPPFDAEACRVVSEMPRWRSGRQGGRAVPVSYTIPVKFMYNGESTSSSGFMSDLGNHSYGYYSRAREFYSPIYKDDDTVETRSDFRKTIYWNPLLSTNDKGEAKITFCTSDELTTFRATVEGIDSKGNIGRGEKMFCTTKPISIDAKIPEIVCYEDTISIPVTCKNSTSGAIEAVLKAEYPEFLLPLNSNMGKITLPANGAFSTYLDFVVLAKQGMGSVKFSLKSDSISDAIQTSIISKPNGSIHKLSFMGNHLSNHISVSLPPFLKNSLRAEVKVFPSLESSFTSAIQAMLREPHGCFEQASASTYPNVFILQYLKGNSQADKGIVEQAERYISDGYKLLKSYETPTQGFEWFGHSPAHEGLTAFGLMEFNDMKSVSSVVDQRMYERTLNWLLGRRDNKGGFNISNGLYGFSTKGYLLNNAYLVYALSEVGNKSIMREFEQACKDNQVSDDAYRLALLANSALNLNDTVKGNEMLRRLKMQCDVAGFRGFKSETSITGSGGVSLCVETVSLYALALQKQKHINEDELNRCVRYILDARVYGVFGSTQANVLALKVLTTYYKSHSDLFKGGSIEVGVNKRSCGINSFNSKMTDPFVYENLTEKLAVGDNFIDVNFTKCLVSPEFQVEVEYYSEVPPSHSEASVHIETIYSKTSVNRGDIMHLTAKISNLSKRVQPMTVAIITIPSGFSFQPWQLKELQEKNVFDYYEVKQNQLHLYYRQLAPNFIQSVKLDLNSDIPGIYHTAVSSCYLYYTPEYRSNIGIERLEIKK